MVKEVPSEEANVSQIEIKTTENQGSDEKSSPADIMMPQVAKSLVGSPEGHETYDNYESLQVNFPESDTNVASDANSLSSTGINQTTHSVGLDDADYSSKRPVEGNVIDDGDHETQKYAITGDEYIEVSKEKIVAQNPITSLENTSCLSEHIYIMATTLVITIRVKLKRALYLEIKAGEDLLRKIFRQSQN